MMFEALKGWVASIIAVILFVSLVEIILPEGKMRKYVNLTAGVLVVLIIISPLFKVFNKSIEIDIPEMSLKESVPLEELKIQGEKIGNMRSKQIIYAYREKMAKNIREQVNEIEGISCEKVVCKIIEDAGKESFGDIQDVTLYINKKQHQGTKSNIQPIKIELNKSTENKADNTIKISEEEKSQIIKKVSNICNITNEHINIVSLESK